MSEITEEAVLNYLITQVEMISGQKNANADTSLTNNGINSMGFMELLLGLQMKYNVNLIDSGISAADVNSLRTLAQKVIRSMEQA